MEPTQKSNKLIGIIIGALVVAGLGLLSFFGMEKNEGMDDDDKLPENAQQTSQATTDAPTTVYKDGTYTASGTYMSPGGADSLDVTLTIKDGIITNSSTVMHPGDDTSAKIMKMFEGSYQSYVVGKSLATLNIGKVSKSSLTPIGFNDAVAKIRVQAKI